MSIEIVEELVLRKQQLETVNQQLLAVLGAVVAGKNGTTEVRLTKATLTKTAGKAVSVRGLKSGGVVVTITDADG